LAIFAENAGKRDYLKKINLFLKKKKNSQNFKNNVS